MTGALTLAVVAEAAMAAAMTGAFGLRRIFGRAGLIDATWTLATGVIGAGLAWAAAASPLRGALVGAACLVWGARLSLHLLRRALTSPDDPRYVALETAWGDSAALRLFLFLQAQAVVGAVLAFSVALAASAETFWLRDAAAVVLFVAALAGEALADRQLAAFKADPRNRGRICDTGLWGRSRHPNYFFEWVVWVAFALAAFDPARPISLIALLAPVTMYWTLRHSSGVPPVEQRMRATRPALFAAYAARTPIFFPSLSQAKRDATQ